MGDDNKKSFEEAGKEGQTSLVREFIQMLKQNKKFWMIPIIVVLLLFGLLIILGGSVMLFIAFIVIAVIGLLNGLISRMMLNVLVFFGFGALIIGVVPYARFVIKEERSLEKTLNELTI